MKITRRQLRRLISEQFGATRGRIPKTQISLEDTGPFMKNAIVRAAMKEINHWKGMTNEHELDPRWQALHRDKPTFESYADSALDEIREKVFKGDYVIPLDMVGMKEMKITKRQLRRIILESLNEARTVPSRWWEYDPQDVVTDIYHQRRQLPPKDWKNRWPDIKRKLEEKWPRPEHLAGETYESGYDYEGGENRGLAAIEYTLPPPTKPPAWWRPGQRVSWNKLAASREHGHLAVPDNYEFFLKAHDKLLADYLKDSSDPNEMAIIMTLALEAQAREAQALEAKAREAQDLGPSASQPATTGFPDLDAKLRRGRGSGHVDLSQLSESRIDLGRWNKMAGTLLCEADYHDFGIPVPAEELRPQSKKLMPLDTALYSGTSADKYGEDPSWSTDPYGEEEDVQATHFSDHPGNLSFLNWAKKVLDASYPDISKISPEMTRQEIDRHLHQIGNSVLHGIAVDAWREGVFPEDYASDMEVLPLPPERGVTV